MALINHNYKGWHWQGGGGYVLVSECACGARIEANTWGSVAPPDGIAQAAHKAHLAELPTIALERIAIALEKIAESTLITGVDAPPIARNFQ